jgi:hypothetical protein
MDVHGRTNYRRRRRSWRRWGTRWRLFVFVQKSEERIIDVLHHRLHG